MSERGSMDIRPQQAMWKDFIRLTTWSVVLLTILLALMAAFLL
jgi:hypothetical protein